MKQHKNTNNMIDIKNIDYSYKKGKKVYTDFSLNIPAGGIYGLLGRNGTGKSTLLYLICGLLKPQKGSCQINNIDASERNVDILKDIFLVPEEFELPSCTLNTYVRINKPFYPNFSEELLNRCLEVFSLSRDIHLKALSMGMKKKVFVSFALATQTRLLLMDEPTNGLDIPSKSQFRRILSWVATEERTIIISTHQVKDVEQLFDHFIIIDENNLLAEASTNKITETFRFEMRDLSEINEDELYSRPTFGGKEVICLNPTGEETPVNLELLFTALVEKPEISKYLNNEK